MDDEINIRCLSAVVQRLVGKDDASGWICLLTDNKLLTRAQRKTLLQLEKDQKIDELFLQSCSLARESRNCTDKLTEAFNDNIEFECNQKSAEIIKKLFEKNEISEEMAWMIDSWDVLQSSDDLRARATSLCPGNYEENWPLDFIHLILTTENSYAEGQFVHEAKKFLESQKQEADEEERMNVDSQDEANVGGPRSTDSDMSADYNKSYVTSMAPSAFQILDSDGEVKEGDEKNSDDDVRVTSDDTSAVPLTSQDSMSSRPLITISSTEELLQAVRPFEWESPVNSSCFDWEMVDPPSVKNEPLHAGDDRPLKVEECRTEPNLPVQDNHEQHNAEPENSDGEKQTAPILKKSELGQESVNRMPISIVPRPFKPKAWASLTKGPLKNNHSQRNTPSLQYKREDVLPTESADKNNENMGHGKKEQHLPQLSGDAGKAETAEAEAVVGSEFGTSAPGAQVPQHPVKNDQELATKSSSSSTKDETLPDHRTTGIGASEKDGAGTDFPPENSSIKQQRDDTAKPAADDDIPTPDSVTKPSRQVSTSSSDSNENSDECEGLDWFSGSINKLKEYKLNIQLLTKLTWPKAENLVAETMWPYELISWLENNSKDSGILVDRFILACRRVIQKTEPLTEKLTKEEGKSGVSWLRSNANLLVETKEDMILLYQLAWPSDNLLGDEEAVSVRDELFAKNNYRRQRGKLKDYSDAAKMLMELPPAKTRIEKAETVQQPADSPPDKPQNKPKQGIPDTIVPKKITSKPESTEPGETTKEKSSSKNPGGSKVQKVKEILGMVKKDKPNDPGGKKSAQEKPPKIPPRPGGESKVKSESDLKSEQTSEPPKASETGQNKMDKAIGAKTEEFHDALAEFHDVTADLEDCVLLTEPPSDDTFEIRAVYTGSDPKCTTMYVIENCWYDWRPIRMRYNSERNFYFINLPLRECEFVLQYKYFVKVSNYTSVWEVLPGHTGNHYVNHQVPLTKDVKYIHDVPVFANQYHTGNKDDILPRHVHLHLPPMLKQSAKNQTTENYISYKKEIHSCVSQMKNGWADSCRRSVRLTPREFDLALMRWISGYLVEGSSEMDVLNRILAVLNLVVSLHKLNHKIHETQLLSFVCCGLNVEKLDAKHQKMLYQLIKQEFATKGSSACHAVREGLLTLYRQLPQILGSATPWVEWILTLPIYWMVANNGEMKKKVTSSKRGGSLYSKSALPEAEKLPWSEVRSKCKNDTCQRALIAMSEKILQISEIHPWIVGSYLYVLTDQSLVQMLKNSKEHRLTVKFGVDSVFSSLLKDWKSTIGKRQALDDAYAVRKYFFDTFTQILSKSGQRSEEERSEQKESAKNMMELILKVTKDFQGYDTFSYSGDKQRNLLFFMQMTYFVAEWIFQLLSADETYDETRAEVSIVLKAACDKISNFYSMSNDEIEFIDKLLRTTWTDDKTQRLWMELIQTEVKALIRKVWGYKKGDFLEFYVKAIENYKLEEHLEQWVEEFAFKCIEHLLKDFSSRKSSWSSGWFTAGISAPRFVKLFGKLFVKEYEKAFCESNTEQPKRGIMKCLQFVINWSFAPRFYQAFYQEKAMSSLTEDVCEKVRFIERDFQQTVTRFCSGRLKISESEFFIQNEKPILEFYSILILKTSGPDISVDDKLATSLSLKKAQLKAISASKSNLETFISLCMGLEDAHILVDVEELEELPIMRDEIVHNVTEPNHKPTNPERGLERIDKLTNDMTMELHIIGSIHNSQTFGKVWKNVLADEEEKTAASDENHISWEEVLGEIWPTAKERTFSVFDAICDGSIAVSVLAKLFDFSGGDKSMISEEMLCLAAGRIENEKEERPDKLLQERCEQIEKILHLRKSERMSRLMLKFKEALSLEGDFQSVEIIQNMEENEEMPLKDVNLDINVNFANELWSDSEFIALLENFVEQEDLIFWLKTQMKDLKEVKTFCDLGMISAGETSYEVDRVSFLLSAVMGFAPLIYDLGNDAGLKEVMAKCEIVKNNVDSDDKLIQKWTDTGRQLTWFEGIHKFHGSVGTQSLTLAQEINSRGIYLIGKPKKGTPTIGNSLKLSLQPDEKASHEERESKEKIATQVKFTSYDGLKDLQSKLMLIAGEAEQGHQDVARFNDVLSAVANLTQGFINLVNAGCMLFNSWSARIICSKEEIVISLNFSDDIQPVSTTSCLKDLELLVGVMDDALDQWTNYIDKMRHKHYYLNDYNIQQISYLCEKLAKSDFTDQVFSLLSDLRRIQICDHMQNALDEATEIQEDEEIIIDETVHNENEALSTLEMKRRMVRELAKNGLSENLAKAAVQCEENKDVEDCENWALLYQYDEDLIVELSEDFDEEAGFGPETNTVKNYISLLHNRTSLTLKELITQIQEKEQDSESEMKIHSIVKTICSTYNDKTSKLTLQDSLSIDHLGKFLNILRTKLGVFTGRVDRRLLAPMQQGKTNLILIPPGDMLYTALSMYMRDKDQPLPTKSEVLVCTEDASEDEVGRFLRRAMCQNPRKEKKLFCMVFADKLTFNVSRHVETLCGTLSAKENFNREHQFVILCSTANQQHYLVTCFDRTRVELKLATAREKISRYLCDKLQSEVSDETSVKLVSSKRSGVGKSLHVKRLIEKLNGTSHVTTIRLLQKDIDVDHVLGRLYRKKKVLNEDAHLIHIDLTSAVESGIEEFTFNLFVLGSIQDSLGQIWRRHSQHIYAVEMTESKMLTGNSVLNLIPCTKCLSPKDVLEKYKSGRKDLPRNEILMDQQEFESEIFQRPFQYLKQYAAGSNLDKFHYVQPAGSEQECIEILLDHCGMKNPSWAQLRYFSSFLNVQLINCEESIFCKQIQGAGRNQDLIEFSGLKAFAVYFMVKMAQDFATPSLRISDESKREEKDALEQYAFRRRWEDEVHPFVFFNEDRTTMTFINVNVNDNGDLLNADGSVARTGMVSKRLVHDLKRQGVPFGEKFNSLSRKDKIRILCQFMNIPREFDPDKTYELTTDNVLKMLAIYMRLRCQIPVIVMGETGCGKTRMIEFMSKMRSGQSANARNMVTLKIHGGIQVMDIYQSVRDAKEIAAQNQQEFGLSTILFYDEANTTSAIFAIKEVVCDFSIDGEDFRNSQLQIVAACNPYKQLSDKAVKKLEESGLGYNIKASEAERVGHVPMRRLVYRVVALPPSMQPFVWDFGQLGDEAEEIYIKQMTNHLKEELELRDSDATLIHSILFNAQCYMRKECKDESRYVSLRDVERSLKTFRWFYQHSDHIFQEVVGYHKEKSKHTERRCLMELDRVPRCLLHTISICYHASLDDRESFRNEISKMLRQHSIPLSPDDIDTEIIACQTVFTASLKMDDNIACNEALRENVFLMTVCTDLRIPLFVVGKPGSSKSLAKTIVGDNMQGKTSYSDLYKHFKQVHILSYQCSALTDAGGIESIFNQCAQLQSNQDIDSYAAVVVLDEIGLAEDSPNMPLKVLHPLLECGSTKNGTLTDFDKKRKVAFVGISNWALDPAKMNRGIFVTRSSPNEGDLQKTAKGIFQKQRNKMRVHSKTIKALTDAYLKLYKAQKREYFGLRDYYSLIKMLHAALKKRDRITQEDVANAIQRNFSGGETSPLNVFCDELGYCDPLRQLYVKAMVEQNLMDDKSRFLLLLTNQYSSFSLLQNFIPDFRNKVQVIFGSSFPNDHSYTEMCRNINRVKVCMETGRTVILLNMTEINESLYDALNQHYVTLGGQRYVDLGLGGHRVKCRIADGFRLIVIELKEKVYNEYPIPLINRLEKHHLTSNSLLSGSERAVAEELSDWVEKFSAIQGSHFTPSHAFLGHNEDSVSSVVISYKQEIEGYKSIILESATMDAVFRLPNASGIGSENVLLLKTYVEEQIHDNLWRLLNSTLDENEAPNITLMEITTFSNILSDSDRKDIECLLNSGPRSVMLLSLQQFQTEQDYLKKLDEFFNFCNKESENNAAVLLVQCSQAHKHTQLIACARYGLKNKLGQLSNCKKNMVIALLLSTERKLTQGKNGKEEGALSLQHTSDCPIIYVDELRPSFRSFRQVSHFHGKTIRDVLEIGRNSIQPEREGDELGISLPTLLNDCICEAMAKVKSKAKNDKRNLECIQILNQMCSGNERIHYHFLRVLVTKMIEIYKEREDEIYQTDNWIVKQACSAESLQEGGTFSKTLWLCLKSHVSYLLAYIISLIDADDNLNIIADTSENSRRVHNMWMEMFIACGMRWEDMRGHMEFETKGKPYKPDGDELRIPFCFMIHRTLEEQWLLLKDEAEKRKLFFNLFCRSTPEMNTAITNVLRLPRCMDVVNSFARNLIKINYSSNGQSLTKLSNTLVNIATVMFQQLREKGELPESHWFLIIFYCIKMYHTHLKVVKVVLDLCPQSIEKMDEWIREIKTKKTILIHEKALEFALQRAKDRALLIKDAESCCDWMNFTRRLRTIFELTVNLIESNGEKQPSGKQELLQSWEPLAMLDMLLLHLLPSPSQEDAFKKYVEVIASHAKLLYKGTSKSGLRGQQFLRIVCNVLRKYYEDVKLKVLLSWQNTMCRICHKVCKLPTILPCGHYFCLSCLRNALVSSQDKKKCSSCSVVLPDDYEPEPTELTDNQNAEVEAFQSHCTSFFLEYLSQFVFPTSKNNFNQEDVIQLILEELVLNMSSNETRKAELETTALNLNIATRTSILSILFGHDQRRVEDSINKYFVEQQNIGGVVLLVIKHFEQIRMQLRHVNEKSALNSCCKLLKRFARCVENEATPSVKFLEIVAEARHSVSLFVKTITENASSSNEDEIENANRKTLLYNIKSAIQTDNSGVLKEYFVKVGCHVHGMDWFSNILQNVSYKNLVPERLRSSGEMNAIDYYTSLGESYSDMRSSISKTAVANHQEKVKEWFPQNHKFSESASFLKILAISSWLKDHQHHKGTFTGHFQTLFPENVDLLNLMFTMTGNVKKWAQAVTGLTKQQKSVLEQLIPFVAAVVKSQPAMFGELQTMMTDPSKVAQLFWPAMPESFYFSMPQELRCEGGLDAMYQCPNGHYYTIGQCTKPWTIARCPDCHAVIGGKGHVTQTGNERVQKLEESSQAGYMLRSTDKNLQSPEDRISMQATSVIQLLIHVCMLEGLERKPAAAPQILQGVDSRDVAQYLFEQINNNIQNLAKSVGRNTDEALLVIFQIVLNLVNTKVNQGSEASKASWNSIVGRKDWEKHFRFTFLLPVFQQLGTVITAAQQNLNAAEDMASIALFRIVHEVKEEENATQDVKEWWRNPFLWLIIEHPNASHLMQCIRDNPDRNTGSVLQTILESPDLEVLRYLDDVLCLQRRMIEIYQNKIDLSEAESNTIEDFSNKDAASIDLIPRYVQAWNELRHQLKNSAVCDSQMSSWFDEEISALSPISNVLPSARGRGRCAKLLTEHLVEIQNSFLLKCFEMIGMNASENEVDASQLSSPSHFVRIDKQADLLPLIYLHTSYAVTEDGYGRHHRISYNIDVLEKQARENFIRNKKLIVVESLPSIKYTQDVGIGSDWDKVMTRSKLQEPLTPKFMQTVDDLVAAVTPAEVCEGVRTLTYAVSFLAKVECDPSLLLHEYLERDLLLAKSRTAVIPRFARIHHTLALYQHLTWHKSVNFVQQGLHPYQEALHQVEQEKITDKKVLRGVKEAFEHMDVVVFQQHLNEMLIKVPDYEKDWSLVDDIFPNLLFIGNEATDDCWFDRIPSEIFFKHVSHLFELAVHHVENAT